MDWIAIDFETANENRNSACALGLAYVHNRKIIKSESILIRPPELYFNPFNTSIHGITEQDVADKPTFAELWGGLKNLFEGKILVAHNASFDISVLRYVMDTYNIPYPKLNYFCTCVIAKKVWPVLDSHSLDTVSDYLNITFNHHEAENDAVACAKVALECYHQVGVDSIKELVGRININAGCLYPGGYQQCGKRKKTKAAC
jgi:DNA polymerase-3 subunit epsilon